MSSAVHLKPNQPIPRDEWLAFCAEHGILFSPRMIGQNVFYASGREVEVAGVRTVMSDTETEITFGTPNFAAVPKGADGKMDITQIAPPESAQEITVSTYHGGKYLQAVADTALLILSRWPGGWKCDPELRPFMELGEAEHL